MLQGFENFFAKIARRLVFVLTRKAELFRIQAAETVFNVEIRKLRHAGERRHRAVREKPPLTEEPSHRHIADLSALRHLLHRRLHLLLRLRQAIESGLLGRHRAARIELTESLVGAAHRAAGLTNILYDFWVELREQLKQRL